MKKYVVSLIAFFVSFTAQASLSAGNFNYDNQSYYSNGIGAYCARTYYHHEYRNLTQWEARILRDMRYDGVCYDGPWKLGAFNFRGRSYFANTVGHYCTYRYYHPQFREASTPEAYDVFRMQYDGNCPQEY